MIESKGVVLQGNGQAQIVVNDVPAPTDRQILIKTHAVGLCGSDMSLFSDKYEGPKKYPIYFGHEWSGLVEAVGPDVTKVKPGDKVTGDCSIFCGTCEFCARDRNLCKTIEKFGITMNGASRQFFLQDEKYVYRAHPDADMDLIALSEPLAVGAHVVRRVAEVRPNLRQEKVLVLGGGTIGLACFFALKFIERCEHVELFDLVTARIEKAIGLGTSSLTDVTAGAENAYSYGGLYSGRGYDAIFETTASPVAFRQSIELVRPLGTVMALGFIPSIEFSLKTLTFKAAHIMGSMGGTGQFETVLDFVLNYPELARQLITHKIPFAEYAKAFETAQDRQVAMKVLITFD